MGFLAIAGATSTVGMKDVFVVKPLKIAFSQVNAEKVVKSRNLRYTRISHKTKKATLRSLPK